MSFQRYLKKNWIVIAPIVISFVAVIVSIQSNNISLKTSKAIISVKNTHEVRKTPEDKWILNIKNACYDATNNRYVVSLEAFEEFWISNSGNLDTTLVNIYFDSDLQISSLANRWATEMIDSRTGDQMFELLVPSGTTIRIGTFTRANSYFQEINGALEYLQYVFSDNNIKGTYEFSFTDDKIKVTYPGVKATALVNKDKLETTPPQGAVIVLYGFDAEYLTKLLSENCK